ncbi:MAG: tRNA (guanosine(37)-N1)-methyltransferase TrmD [Kiritimatiellia bacterium]
MRIDIITVFPEMFCGFLGESMIARAAKAGKVFIRTVDLRDFSRDQRRTVDDKPYSGGPGMLMKPEVWYDAVETCLAASSAPSCGPTSATRIVMTTPTGAPYTQRTAEAFSKCDHLVFLCGHYEGFDARVRRLVTDEVSMGDFVLTGGEIPVAAMIDSAVRLLPGVLGGGAAAVANESFGEDGLLEGPQYTRPPVYRGMAVPEVLLNGDHAKAAGWRKRQAFDLTSRRRPDLLEMGGTFANGELGGGE